MTISFIAYTNFSTDNIDNTGSTSLSKKPVANTDLTGYAVGDMLVYFANWRVPTGAGASNSDVTLALPGGWTSVISVTSSTSLNYPISRVFYKIAASTSETMPTLVFSNPSGRIVQYSGHCSAWRGCNTIAAAANRELSDTAGNYINSGIATSTSSTFVRVVHGKTFNSNDNFDTIVTNTGAMTNYNPNSYSGKFALHYSTEQTGGTSLESTLRENSYNWQVETFALTNTSTAVKTRIVAPVWF